MSTIAQELSRALRRKIWIPQDVAPYFHMGQKIARHARRRFDVTDLDKAIAYCIMADMGFQEVITQDQRSLYDAARLIFETCIPENFGPIVDRASQEARAEGQWVPSPQRIRWICEERIDQDTAARIAEQGDPYAKIRLAVERATDLHPRLGLSFGYIGNVGIHGDDRSWYVFAKLATPRCVNACDVSFGGVVTDVIEDLAEMIDTSFASWLAECERRLDAGEIRIVGAGDRKALAA